MRNGARRRVSLVLPDNTERLFATIVAHKRHAAAKLHESDARIRHDQLRANTSGLPVPKVSRRLGESFSIAAGLSFSVRTLRGFKLNVDLR